MDITAYIKKVGNVQTIQNQKGEQIAKISIVLTSKECRTGDMGTYAYEQDYVVDLLGDRASQFPYQAGEWVVASLGFTAREYNGSFFQDIRLNRIVKL